jgi:hypothetical protein
MLERQSILNTKILDKYLTWSAVALAAIVFTWSYVATKDLTRSLILPGKVVLPLFIALKFWLNRRTQKKESGLTKDEFVVSEAGGYEGLLKVIKILHRLGWIFVLMPPIVTAALWVKMPAVAGLFGIIFGVLFVPIGLWLFYSASTRQVIADKLAKSSDRHFPKLI